MSCRDDEPAIADFEKSASAALKRSSFHHSDDWTNGRAEILLYGFGNPSTKRGTIEYVFDHRGLTSIAPSKDGNRDSIPSNLASFVFALNPDEVA